MPALKVTTVLRGFGPGETMGVGEKLGFGEHFVRGEKLVLGEKHGAVEKLGHYLLNRTVDDGGDGGINDMMRGVMYSYAHAILEERLGSPQTVKSEESSASFQDLSLGSSLSSVDQRASNVQNSKVGSAAVAAKVISTSAIGIDSTDYAPADMHMDTSGIALDSNSEPVTVSGEERTAAFLGEKADTDQVPSIVMHELPNVGHPLHDTAYAVGERPRTHSQWIRGLGTRWWEHKQSPRRPKRRVLDCFCSCIRGSQGVSGEEEQSLQAEFQMAIIKRASCLMLGSDGKHHL